MISPALLAGHGGIEYLFYFLVVGPAFLTLICVGLGLMWFAYAFVRDTIRLGQLDFPWTWMIIVAGIFAAAGAYLVRWSGIVVATLFLLVFALGKARAARLRGGTDSIERSSPRC